MKEKIEESIDIPKGFSCTYEKKILVCRKDSSEISRKIDSPKLSLKVNENKIVIKSEKATKKEKKTIHSIIAHLKNIFSGMNDKFIYKLEACYVHFPMTLKIEGSKLVIGNFLGEKTPRHAEIVKNANVEVKGQFITITSFDKEAAGQTAANFEKATKIRGRDRRVFQDGIFITSKPERRE